VTFRPAASVHSLDKIEPEIGRIIQSDQPKPDNLVYDFVGIEEI
jgi:hypothetical protein